MSGDKSFQGCQGLKAAKGVKGQKFSKVPRFKGVKGAWVTSSEGLLRGRVLSRTHFRSSLSPEEGPSCMLDIMDIITSEK